MAQSKLHKNAILTGCVDSLCLVCEIHLKCKQDALLHTSSPDHKEKLNCVPYMEKYGDDNVRKVKRGYYCGYCNNLLMTGAKVDLHVTGTSHKRNKGSCLWTQLDEGVAYKNVMICAKAWHGVLDDSCCLCNMDIEDFVIHSNEPSHIIRLIQSEIEYWDNDYLYRMIDRDSFQCLTCNQVLASNVMKEHFENTEHQSLYTRALFTQNRFTNTCTDEPIHKKTNNNTLDEHKTTFVETDIKNQLIEPNEEEINESTKILDSVHKIQKSGINVNFEMNTAFCKKCLSNVNFNYIAIQHHLEEHKLNLNTVDSAFAYPTSGRQTKEVFRKVQDNGPTVIRALTYKVENNILNDDFEFEVIDIPPIEDLKTDGDDHSNENTESECELTDLDKEIKDFAKTHNITYDKVKNFAYCRFCESRVPPKLHTMKEHIAGAGHKIRATKVSQKTKSVKSRKEPSNSLAIVTGSTDYLSNLPLNKMPLEDFIRELIACKTSLRDYIVNKEFCLTFLSFMTLTADGSVLRCQGCSERVAKNNREIVKHVDSKRHRKAFEKSQVVMMMVNMGHFVRELRPNVFHCGHCNKVVPGLRDLCHHITTSAHKQEKYDEEVRLKLLLQEYYRDRALFMYMREMFGHMIFDLFN